METKKEKGKNNLALKAAAGTVLIILLAVGILLAANMAFAFRDIDERIGPPQEGLPMPAPGEMAPHSPDLFFTAGAVTSSLMLLLSIYLVYTYLKDYLELKSHFTLGVLSAVIAFMLFAITANPLLHFFLGVYGRFGVMQIIPYVFATISLAILAWVSSK
jgi:hypothetical protein